MAKENTTKWAYLNNELVCIRGGDLYYVIGFGKLKETNDKTTILFPYTGNRSTLVGQRLVWISEGKPIGISTDLICGMEIVTKDFIDKYIEDFNRYGEAQENGFLISELENKTKLGDMQKDKSRKVGL